MSDDLRLRVAKALGLSHASWWSIHPRGDWTHGVMFPCASEDEVQLKDDLGDMPGLAYLKTEGYRTSLAGIPAYDTDWNEAGKLLEIIVSEGASFSLIYYQNVGKWNCEIFTNLRMRNADATTGPAAISEAFCAWKEASNE